MTSRLKIVGSAPGVTCNSGCVRKSVSHVWTHLSHLPPKKRLKIAGVGDFGQSLLICRED